MFDDDYTPCFDDNVSAIDDTFNSSFEPFDYSTDCHMDDHFESCSLEDTCINPANGLPMAGGSCGGVDVAGNPYGTDDSWNDEF